MAITRHNKILYTWKKLKTNKTKMRIKENKENKSISWKKIIKRLGYESSLSKERKFKSFCEKN